MLALSVLYEQIEFGELFLRTIRVRRKFYCHMCQVVIVKNELKGSLA